jgi:hypothetical protein
MKKLLLLLVFCSLLSYSQSIKWTNATSSYSLPDGVQLFKGERDSPLLKIFYLDVNLNNKNIAVKSYLSTVSATKEIITSFLPRVNAIAGINGGYFDISTGASYAACVSPDGVQAKNITSVTRDSKSYILTRSFFGITETREMAVDWIYHFGAKSTDIYRYTQPTKNANGPPAGAPSQANGKPYYNLLVGIGGGPTLVKSGKINVTYNEEVFWGSGVGLDNGDPRTAVGYTKNNHCIMIVADGRQTSWSNGVGLTELAQIMIDLGCVEAMNLDGGGSTQMAVGNKLVNTPSESRPVPTILAVVKADSVPFLPPVYYNKIIDSNDPEVSVTGADWDQSTIAGYWNNTPAIYQKKGSGDKYVTFKPKIAKKAVYDVYAWWTAAVNRAKDTPFIIKHKNGTDTVRMDQSVNGVKWNHIGSYTFDADTNNAVIISNAATNGDVVVADAIRILSFDSTTAVTSVETGKADLPAGYLLDQNYPNPFNPSTNISYELLNNSKVNLKIYDLLGREVAMLVNEEKPAGRYNTVFDANAMHLSSGVYFYRLIAGNYSSTKKMVLTK